MIDSVNERGAMGTTRAGPSCRKRRVTQLVNSAAVVVGVVPEARPTRMVSAAASVRNVDRFDEDDRAGNALTGYLQD